MTHHKQIRIAFGLGCGALLLIALLWLMQCQFDKKLYGSQIKFNSSAWSVDPLKASGLTTRHLMIQDIILNVLPGKKRAEVEELFGKSPTHENMRRHSQSDFLVRERNEDGSWKPFPKTGIGYYYEEFGWDLIYTIGYEQSLDQQVQVFSADRKIEVLLIRFDSNNIFSSWYIDGSKRWPQIVGKAGRQTFKRQDD